MWLRNDEIYSNKQQYVLLKLQQLALEVHLTVSVLIHQDAYEMLQAQ